MSTASSVSNNNHKRTALLYISAVLLGVAAGCLGSTEIKTLTDFVATVFTRLFKFISVPIIAVSIITTLAAFSNSAESGRIFKRTISYTLITTVLSATVAACVFLVLAPSNVAVTGSATTTTASRSYIDYLINIIPDNVLTPFVSGNVLSVLLIAAAIGFAIASLPKEDESKKVLMTFFNGIQKLLFKLVHWLIVVMPIGIFGFVAQLMGDIAQGVQLAGLGTYFTTIVSANLIQILIILPLFLLARGLNPVRVAQGMMPALTLAFFSKSSAGTLPLTMASAENNLKIRPQVARFVLPICTTINMNGCAAFILVTVIYLMQNAGVDITAGTLALWIGISTLAAVGNAGVPMGCFFLATSLLSSMNIPILLMGVILPFYAVIDMIETTLNVWSDSTVAAMVDHDLYH